MRTPVFLAVAVAALVLTACTDSRRARTDTNFTDRPADVTCWSHGTEIYSGRSTGKVENYEGRIAFVDAATSRYTTVGGDCRVVYQPAAQ